MHKFLPVAAAQRKPSTKATPVTNEKEKYMLVS